MMFRGLPAKLTRPAPRSASIRRRAGRARLGAHQRIAAGRQADEQVAFDDSSLAQLLIRTKRLREHFTILVDAAYITPRGDRYMIFPS